MLNQEIKKEISKQTEELKQLIVSLEHHLECDEMLSARCEECPEWLMNCMLEERKQIIEKVSFLNKYKIKFSLKTIKEGQEIVDFMNKFYE